MKTMDYKTKIYLFKIDQLNIIVYDNKVAKFAYRRYSFSETNQYFACSQSLITQQVKRQLWLKYYILNKGCHYFKSKYILKIR